MSTSIRIIQYGCGPIGCAVARLAAQRASLAIVGAVDIDPGKIGKDIGDVSGLGRKLGVLITDDSHSMIERTSPSLAFHTTGSSLATVFPQIAGLVEQGLNVISTCEELSYPFRNHPDIASKLNTLAQRHGVSVLGTGINPGFLMDVWPLFMTAVCPDVEQVRVSRIQDASQRRLPFQKKIGAGMTLEEFSDGTRSGSIRHVGLAESIAMIGDGLGFRLDEIVEQIEPIVAERTVSSEYLTVEKGQAVGVHQVGKGLSGGATRITLDFAAYLGAPESYDEVEILGSRNLKVRVVGGTHGDIGTAAIAVNAARRVVGERPGLLTMKDIAPVVYNDANHAG